MVRTELGEGGTGAEEAPARQGRPLCRGGHLFERFGEDAFDPADVDQVDLQGEPAGGLEPFGRVALDKRLLDAACSL